MDKYELTLDLPHAVIENLQALADNCNDVRPLGTPEYTIQTVATRLLTETTESLPMLSAVFAMRPESNE
jgi:hypothetical protein